MEKKKIAIVAIIIFIFAGLMVFTFANPEEEEKPGTTKPGENTHDVVDPEKQNEDEEVIDDEEASESRESVVDDSYDKALKAVEDAEKLLTREAYDKAVALVAKSSKNKNALTERLEKVDHDLDIQELVNDLNNKLASATSRDDILAAISFRDDNTIDELVATVNNAELKGTLENLMTEINAVLDDETAPSINLDKEYYNEDVTVNFDDDNELVIKVSKDGEDAVETANGSVFSEEGTYTVTAVDAAFNETTYTFTIDKTAPVVNVSYDVTEYTKNNVVVILTSDEELQTVDGFETTDNIIFTKTITENTDGDVEVVVADLAGNTFTAKYNVANIDKVKPTITVADTSVGSDGIYSIIDVVLADNVELNFVKINETVKKINLTGTEATLAFDGIKEYLTEGVNTVRVKDKAGNQFTLTFTLDTTAPVVNVNSGSQSKQNIDFVVTELNFDKAMVYKDHASVATEYTDKEFSLTEDGTYQVVISDKAGNNITVWVAIDKTTPVIEGVTNKAFVNTDVELVITDRYLMTVEIDGTLYDRSAMTVGTNGENFKLTNTVSEEGKHTVVATDKAGNVTTYTFTIDKTKPTMHVANVGVSGEADPTVVLNHIAGLNKTINFTGFVSEELDMNSIEFYLVQGENEYKIPSENIGYMNVLGTHMYIGSFKVTNDITLDDGYVDIVARNVKDLAGNVTEEMSLLKEGVTLLIDRTAPVIKVDKSTSVGNNDIFSKVDFILTDENGITKTVVNSVYTNNRTVDTAARQNFDSYKAEYVEGKNTVVLYDIAGNTATYEFTLDTIAPVLTLKDDSLKSNSYVRPNLKLHDETGINKVVVNGVQEFVQSFNKWGDFNYGSYINYVDGNNTVELYDMAGNKTSYTFKYDKTAPTMTVKDSSVGLNNIYKKLDLKLHDAGNVDYITVNGTKHDLSNSQWGDLNHAGWINYVEGENTVVLYDVFGNSSTFTFTYNPNLVVITNDSEFASAITNQADNQYWLIKEGTYTLSKNNTIEYGSQTGWFLPIVKNNIKIEGVGNVSISVDSMPENGVWASQDMIVIGGNNVEIKNVTLGGFQNKLIEVIGDNAKLTDITANAWNSKEAGSIYIGATGITTTLKNVTLNKGRVTLSGANSTNTLNMDNVTINYAGGEYEANAFPAFNDHSGATINAKDLTISMSNAFGGNVIDALNMLPANTTVNLTSGNYNIGSATLNKKLVINGNGATLLGNLNITAAGTKLVGLNITSDWNNALVISANNVKIYGGRFATNDVNKQGEGTIRYMAGETSNLVVKNADIVGGIYIDNYTGELSTLLTNLSGNTVTMQYSGLVPMGNIIFHTTRTVNAGFASQLAGANTLNHSATKGYEVLIHNTGGWDILAEVKFGFEE